MAKQHSQSRSNGPIALLALILSIVGGSSMAYYHLGLFIPRMLEARGASGLGKGYSWGDDFHPVWLTAREAITEHRDPYSPEITRQLQIGVFGRPLDARNPHDPPVDYRQFAYPAFTDLVMWPGALLPFPQLRVMLALLLPLLIITTLGFWTRALDWQLETVWFAVLVLLALTTYEVLEALFAEQLGLFVAVFLAGAALAIRKECLLLAGSLTALTLMKPETSSLAILYLLLWSLSDRRRWRFWQGFLIVSLALVAGSVLAWPHWIAEWIHIVLGYTRYAQPPLILVLLGKSVPSYFGWAIIVSTIGAGVALACRYRTASAQSWSFWFTLSLLLAITSLAILPGQAIYDHMILIPGILLVVLHRRRLLAAGPIPRAMLSAGAIVLFWPWIAASLLLLLRNWLPDSVFYSPALFTLPIRTAASLPFAVLALLWLTWRVTARDPEPS
jgi:Glycosyltransferase family 87